MSAGTTHDQREADDQSMRMNDRSREDTEPRMPRRLSKIPLAFFAYNRPEHTSRALSALAKCRRQGDFEFFFFSDGPRRSDDVSDVDAVRRVLADSANRFGAEVIERPENLGLAKSIVDGVSRLCEQYGRVVVLEDDLIVAPDFLHFMASALDRYADVGEVMQVGAYTIAPPPQRDSNAFLLPVTTTWGWGTWDRAWKKFSWTPQDWPSARSNEAWVTRFQINGAGKYISMLEDRLAGRNDSWGILWWYAVSRNKGQVVYPVQTLVSNEGFDGSGVHCGAGTAIGQSPHLDMHQRLPEVISFPSQTEHQAQDLQLLEAALRAQSGLPARVNSKALFWVQKISSRIRNALF